jgi:hypothetical protein
MGVLEVVRGLVEVGSRWLAAKRGLRDPRSQERDRSRMDDDLSMGSPAWGAETFEGV